MWGDFYYATTVRRLAGAGVGRAAHLRGGIRAGSKRQEKGQVGREVSPRGWLPAEGCSFQKKTQNPQKSAMVAGAGFEPATSGL